VEGKMALLSVKVAQRLTLAEGIGSFELVDVQGGALPPFSAGSHIDVHMPNGLVRQYSLCNPPTERHRYLIAVLRDPASRGGSAAMHERIGAGDMLQISEPRNHFALVPAQRSLLFAGGIGVTPILCMAEHLAQTDSEFEMHYCCRSMSCIAFAQRLRAAQFADSVHVHLDDGPDAQKLDLDRALVKPSRDTHLYVCGPTGFMSWVIGNARRLGWADANIHREFFVAAPADTPNDRAFEVKIASTGQIVTVPRERSIVAALHEAGVEIPTSCEQGVCGSCLTGVLEGEVDHRDMFLSDAEKSSGDQFTPCVSRALSKRLVLDL
jgi:vanillate monooxygenase ferredoxin subunit